MRTSDLQLISLIHRSSSLRAVIINSVFKFSYQRMDQEAKEEFLEKLEPSLIEMQMCLCKFLPTSRAQFR